MTSPRFAPITIRTRYAGPTNYKGARVIASIWWHGEKCAQTSHNWTHVEDAEGEHAAAVRKVIAKHFDGYKLDGLGDLVRCDIPGEWSSWLWVIPRDTALCRGLLTSVVTHD